MSEYWKTYALEPAQAVKRAVDAVVFAVINHGEDEPPVRPWTFQILDERGVEREVYAPPGHVMQVCDLEDWRRRKWRTTAPRSTQQHRRTSPSLDPSPTRRQFPAQLEYAGQSQARRRHPDFDRGMDNSEKRAQSFGGSL